MTHFELTTHDPDEDYDEFPVLLPLVEWLAQHHQGNAAYQPDRDEGIGVRFRSDGECFQFDCFGDPRSLAYNLNAAANRLEGGQLALLRTAVFGLPTYLFLAPQGDLVRFVEVSSHPAETSHYYPYQPCQGSCEDSEIEQVFAWAQALVAEALAPTDNPYFDRARGKGLRLNRITLIRDLRANAQVAWQCAQSLNCEPLPNEGPWQAQNGAISEFVPVEHPTAPAAQPTVIHITGLTVAFQKVQLLKLIRAVADLPLASARELLALAADGTGFSMTASTLEEAHRVLQRAREVGAVAHLS